MKKLFFIGIIILAAFLRLWQLGVVPVSPDWDEAALGYNAYSILKTGKDEYGIFLPRTLRSFDDYKPPLYTYLAIPSVAAFGLTTWATRLPSAVMGILAVIGTYYLVSLLVKKKDDTLALLTSFFLAISPWHLQFSRIAFEANTGVTLNIWGLVAFFRGLTSLPWMVFAAFLFGISLYAYHSERIFVPLLLLVVSVLWRKELFSDKKKIAISIMVGLLTVLPLIPVLLDKTSVTRLKGTSTLSDTTGLLMRSVKKLEDDIRAGDRIGVIMENRRIVYARTLLDGYISHFSLRWLFLTGDNDRHHAPDNGLLYFFELPFLFIGLYTIWKKGGKLATLVVSWILLAPLAASPTSETPHAIRTLVVLPILQLCIAVGFYGSVVFGISLFKKTRGVSRFVMGAGGVVAVTAIAANLLFYFHMYYVHMNLEYSPFWQYGYKQAVEYAEANKHKYDKIVVSTKLEQPHMFFLFYTKYDPAAYLAAGGTASGGFKEVRNRFDKYEFRPIPNWANEKHDGSVLYIGSPKEIPGSPMVISYLDGPDAIRISE
ncbi:MAG: ArnT family glycosyltransferase [Patescibacteria group bacterium]